MKRMYAAEIAATTLTLAACTGSDADVSAEATTTVVEDGPITVAGGEA